MATVEPEQPRRSRPPGPARHLAIPGGAQTPRRERTARWRPKPPVPKLPPDVTEHLTTEDRVGLLRAMLMMRGIEERAMTLYRQGKVPGQLLRRVRPGGRVRRRDLGDGRRRTACASCTATSPRTSSAASSRGASSPSTWAAQDGITRGRDGNVHFGDRTKGCVGMISMLPDMMLIATGMAMAFKLRGEAALRDHLVRRRLDLARRLPRGHELGRRAEAAGDLRPREQPVRVLDAARPAVRGQPGRARRRLRLPGRERRRQRPRGDVRGRPRRPRARARRRGPDAGRGRDDAHARPRRARRHEVRPDREGRGVAREGPDRPPGQAPGGARRRHAGDPRRASRPRSTPPSSEALQSPMPDGNTVLDGLFADEPVAARGRQRPLVRLQGRLRRWRR